MKHQLKQSYSIRVCWCSSGDLCQLVSQRLCNRPGFGGRYRVKQNEHAIFKVEYFVVKNMVNQSRTRQKTFHKGSSDDLPEFGQCSTYHMGDVAV